MEKGLRQLFSIHYSNCMFTRLVSSTHCALFVSLDAEKIVTVHVKINQIQTSVTLGHILEIVLWRLPKKKLLELLVAS